MTPSLAGPRWKERTSSNLGGADTYKTILRCAGFSNIQSLAPDCQKGRFKVKTKTLKECLIFVHNSRTLENKGEGPHVIMSPISFQ